MTQIVRLYITDAGVEKCIKEPGQIAKLLRTATEPIDLDWHDERGHAHMGTSAKFSGKTVMVGDEEVEVAVH